MTLPFPCTRRIMIRTGMRANIKLIRKHPKIRRILRCESPYFHHCTAACSCFLATRRAVHTDSMLQTNCNGHFPVMCHYPTLPRNHSVLPAAFWLRRINLLHLHQTSIIFPILTRRRFLRSPSVSHLCASICLAVGLTH